jgi:LacI family transcriptional regulator
MKKKIKIGDIAVKLGVSPSAVSLALNDKPGIGTELRMRIKNYAARLGYFQNRIRVKSNYVAVVYAYAGNHIASAMDAGITGVLKKFGYLEIRYSFYIEEMLDEKQRERNFERIMSDQNIAGIIVVMLNMSDVLVSRMQRNNIPVVLLNTFSPYGLRIDMKDHHGAFLATDKLISLGHTKIGFILPDFSYDTVWEKRKSGYKDALLRNGTGYEPGLIEVENTFTEEGVTRATSDLVKRSPGMTGIIYGSDLQAFFGIKKLIADGYRVPEDMSVVGFDDMIFCGLFTPALTSVRMPFYDMGRKGAELLLRAMKEQDLKDQLEELEPVLVERNSCGNIVQGRGSGQI